MESKSKSKRCPCMDTPSPFSDELIAGILSEEKSRKLMKLDIPIRFLKNTYEEDIINEVGVVKEPVNPPVVGLPQYTPSIRNAGIAGADGLLEQSVYSLSFPVNVNHTPDGATWITSAQWDAAVWDGIPYNPCGKTLAQLNSFAFPNANTMSGLRERFYELNPFADIMNPTVAEIDNWNIEVIKHFRAIFGITHPIEADKCLFLRAQWKQERKYSTFWDAEYPGTFDSAYGPCVGGVNGHCGSTFVPSCSDQSQYFSENDNTCCDTLAPGAENLGSFNSNLPWSIKLSRVIKLFLGTEGLSGHTGPFLSRSKVGLSFYWSSGSSGQFVGKWSGDYVNPCP